MVLIGEHGLWEELGGSMGDGFSRLWSGSHRRTADPERLFSQFRHIHCALSAHHCAVFCDFSLMVRRIRAHDLTPSRPASRRCSCLSLAPEPTSLRSPSCLICLSGATRRRTNGSRSRIPLWSLTGDEMTRIIWKKIREEVGLFTHPWDLPMLTRPAPGAGRGLTGS